MAIKQLFYIAVAIYVFSFIAAGDPDWVINHIPPLVVGVLVLIGTVLFKKWRVTSVDGIEDFYKYVVI